MSKKTVIQKIRTQYLKDFKRVYKDSEAIVIYEKLEKVAQENDLKEYAAFFQGGILHRKNNYQAAINAFKKAIELDNGFAYPWCGLGNTYNDLKEYQAAIDAFKKAIELDNDFAYPWRGLGNTYGSLKEYQAAIDAYKKAIEIDNDFASPWYDLGIVYYYRKEHLAAIDAFKKAIEIDNDFPHPWHGLGNTYGSLKEYQAAIDAYKKAIEIDNDFASPWHGLGNIYNDLKEYQAAIDAYKKAIELDNNFVYPWNGLGITYNGLKEYQAAIDAYKKAIEIDNDFSHSYRNLGLLRKDQGEDEEAEKNFLKALTLFKKEGDDYWVSITASSLYEIRRKIKSKKEYERKRHEKKLDASWIVLQDTKGVKDKAFKNQKNFLDFLTETENKKNKENGENYFQVLRRWNSYTPIIADNYHISKGGGYFINIGGKGIVIDPGFNFIDNFKGSKHLFNDIDAVITSHAHNDHTSDIESILALLYKYNEAVKGIGSTEEKTIRSEIAKEKGCDINKVSQKMVEDEFKKSKRRKEINLYITISVFKKFTGLFDLLSNTDYKIHTIEDGSQLEIGDNITIKIIGAKHFDIISDRDSTGMVISYNGVTIIYTGDTGWSEKIEEQYKKIAEDYSSEYKLLVAHLGGFKEYEQFYKTGDNDYSCFYKNHLGRLGLAKINETIKPDICFISEFGEELKGHRMEIADIFNKAFNDKKTFFLPADIGLTLNIDKRKIKAITKIDVEKNSVEYGFVEPKKVKCCLLRKDYSLHYFSSEGNFKESDLMQILSDQYDRSTK